MKMKMNHAAYGVAAILAACTAAAWGGTPAGRAELPNGAELGFAIVLGVPCDTKTAEVVVGERDMRERTETDAGGIRRIVWRGSSKAGENLAVTATLEPKEDGLFEWTFSYEGLVSPLEVIGVRFPKVTVPYKKTSRVLRAYSQGMLVNLDWDAEECGPLHRLGTHMWPYRLTALVNTDAPSFYMDRRSEGFAYARNQWKKERPGALTVWFEHSLPIRAEKSAQTLQERGRLGFYRGGWYEAAMLYRPWARSRAIYRRAKARDFSRLREIGLWMWNRGRIDNVIPPVKRFMKDSGVPTALDWYWWHSNPYDTSYPNFWPPREGVEKFTAAVSDMTKAGIYSQVYINGARWDCDDPSYAEGGRDDELIFRNGRPHSHMYNPFTAHRLTQMCGEAPHYQARVVELSKKLHSTGLTGLYMDQIAMSAYQPCYQRRHSHTPGDAEATVKGFRDYVSRVQAANPGWLLSGEDVSEAYMDLFMSGIVCYSSMERYRKRYGFKDCDTIEMVPVYSALYHGAMAIFGSFATMDGITPWDELWPQEKRWKVEKPWHRLFPDQYAVEFCRGVVWGQQPTVHNFKLSFADDPEFADDYRFTVDTARFYHAHRDWLFDGDMLAPGKCTCDGKDVRFLVRGVFAKEGDYKEYDGKGLPTVLHSVWRSPDGRIGAALVNWTRESRAYRIDTPDMGIRTGTLPARSWAWIERK